MVFSKLPSTSFITYPSALKACQFLGLTVGCVFDAKPLVMFQISESLQRILKYIFGTYYAIISTFVIFLSFDFIVESDPSIKSISNLIVQKAKDFSYNLMGIFMIIVSWSLRKDIQYIYHHSLVYMNRYHLFRLKPESRRFFLISLTVAMLHPLKAVINDVWLMFNENDSKVLMKIERLILPFPTNSTEEYLIYFPFIILNDIILTFAQGYLVIILTIVVHFSRDAFEEIVDDLLSQLDGTNTKVFTHILQNMYDPNVTSIIAKKPWISDASKNPAIPDTDDERKTEELQKRWNYLKDINEKISSVGGIHVCILFPFATAALISRLASGVLNFTEWSWSSYGGQVVSGIFYFLKVLIIIESGHRFKSHIIKMQNVLRIRLDLLQEAEDWKFIRNKKRIITISKDILSQKWFLSAAGYFTIDRSIVTSILSTSMTYFVIIFQLRSSELFCP